jgi:hypothetical protein
MPQNRYYAGPPTDHFDGVRFFNPGQPGSDRGLSEVLRWKAAGAPAKWPELVVITPAVPEPRVDGLRITAVGHATLLIQSVWLNILTDPSGPRVRALCPSLGPRGSQHLASRSSTCRLLMQC